jgi:transcription initiation factor TFIID subunit 5
MFQCVQWHVNCNYIATGSSDKTVRLWDVQTGECMRIFTGHRGMVLSLAMSSDGRYMASGDEDGAILMWDLGSGRCVTPLLGHTGCVWTLAFRYSIVLEGECQENSRVTSRELSCFLKIP